MFRILKLIVASIGYLLFLLILFFGVFPYKTTASEKLELSNFVECSDSSDLIKMFEGELKKNGIEDTNQLQGLEKLKNLDFENITSFEELSELLPPEEEATFDDTNVVSPQQTIEQLNKASEQIAGIFGSRASTKTEYCVLLEDNTGTLATLEAELQKRKDYTVGTADNLINSIGSMPFMTVPAEIVDIKAVLTRSNYCNRPINLSDLYLFYPFDSNGVSGIIMFNIELKEDTEASVEKKFLSNLIKSGQYFKSKFYCNGK